MDDTLNIIRQKNNELKDQLRSLINQETPYKRTELKPLDANKISPERNDKFTDFRASRIPTLRTTSINGSPIKQTAGDNTRNRDVKQERYRASEDHAKNPEILLKKPDIPTKNPENTPKIPTKLPKLPLAIPQYVPIDNKPNLLLSKVTAQTSEIEALKNTIRQLKDENNVLQQDNYLKLQTINHIRSQEAENLATTRNEYERRIDAYHESQQESANDITRLKQENTHLQNIIADKDREILAVREIGKSLNKEVMDMRLAEDQTRQKLGDLKTYNRLLKHMIQNHIINRFNDNLDKLGLLLEGNNEVGEDNDTDNTTRLLYGADNTTDVLLKNKIYPSIESLMVSNTKLYTSAKGRLKGYIRFVICVNRFRRNNR